MKIQIQTNNQRQIDFPKNDTHVQISKKDISTIDIYHFKLNNE